MKIGFFLTARLGSTRLPRKHLIKAEGKAFEEWLIHRIASTFAAPLKSNDALIAITTTSEPENEAFKQFKPLGVVVFEGSKTNIPLRHLQAARHLGVDAIVSVDGDDILCATEALKAVYDGLLAGADGIKTEGLPLGMNACGYSTKFLEQSLTSHKDALLETGWGRIFDNSRFSTVQFHIDGAGDDLRYTLDYPEDATFFKAVIKALGTKTKTATAQAIVSLTTSNGLQSITAGRVKEYWDNFYSEQAKDTKQSETRSS